MRRLLSTSLLAFGLSGLPVAGQGVPIIDGRNIARQLQQLLQLEADEVTQDAQSDAQDDMTSIKRRQLDTLDEMIDAFSGISPVGPMSIGGGSGMEPMNAVYGPLANPAGGLMFGDAREDIEQLIIRGTADTYGLPGVARAGLSPVQWRCLMQALIWQESRFQVGARSPAAAFGLTQIIPGTAQYLGVYPDYYTDPYLQVVGGARYFAEQLDRFDGNIIFALAAYNAGPGRVIQYHGVPPFDETQHYVQVIPAKYNSYLATVGGPDALGTLDPAEYAVANASLVSSGSMHYASHSLVTAGQALRRVRGLVEAIDDTASVKEAYDLNTAIRAEVLLIVAARLRTKAARTQANYAQVSVQLTRQREAMAFLAFSQPDL
jgi:hypothetical protein